MSTVNQTGTGFKSTLPNRVSYIREYHIWYKIKNYCINKESYNYRFYGGKGITINHRWALSFTAFIDDVGYAPSKNHILSRRNKNKGYYKENCQWVLKNEKGKFSCKINGRYLRPKEISEQFNIPLSTVYYRINSNKPIIEKSPALKNLLKIRYKGESYTFKEAAKKYNISKSTIYLRKSNGWTDQEIIEGKKK